MISFLFTILCCFASVFGLSHSLVDSPCWDWIPFKNEKCIKLVERAGFQTKEDGEIVCNAFAEEFHVDDIPKLVTIKTKEEQNFLRKLLFEDLADLDNIWLGLELETDDVYHWNDGTDLLFTNWVNESLTDSDRRCVQMESGEGAYERGKWVKANCKKKNAIACERTQTWSIGTMQNILLSLKLEVARNKVESEQKLNNAKKEAEQKLNQKISEADQKLNEANQRISEADQKLNEANQRISEADQKLNEANQMISEASKEITSLKQNPVPVGFVYVQLPGQEPPTTLWPQTSWKDVGSNYAGLFFRVEGDGAAPFGQLQEDNTRRIVYVDNKFTDESILQEVPSDGSWSKYIWTGTNAAGSHLGLTFRLTPGEIRPRNKAVKVWQRVK